MSRFLIDPITPSASEATQQVASNLNQSADRDLRRAEIEASKMLAKARIDADATLQATRLEHDTRENKLERDLKEKEMQQREELAKRQLDHEKLMVEGANKFTKEMFAKHANLEMGLHRLQIDAARTTDEQALKASKELSEKFDKELDDNSNEISAVSMALQQAIQQKQYKWSEIEDKAHKTAAVVDEVYKAALEATQAGVVESTAVTGAQQPTLLHDVVVGSPVGAMVAPMAAGKALGRMGERVARTVLGQGQDPVEETWNRVSRVAERVTTNLSNLGLLEGVDPEDAKAALGKVLVAAETARGIVQGEPDSQEEQRQMQLLAQQVEKARGVLTDPVLKAVADTLSNQPLTGVKGEGEVRGVMGMRELGHLIQAGAAHPEGGGRLMQKVDTEGVLKKLTQFYDRLTPDQPDVVVDQLVRMGVPRPKAVQIVQTIPEDRKDPKVEGEKEQMLLRKRSDLVQKAQRETEQKVLEARVAGGRAQSERFKSMLLPEE